LELNLVGVSFHVGSNSKNAQSFAVAIKIAYDAFEYARSIGFNPNILDIGGGFPGGEDGNGLRDLGSIPNVINECLDEYFPIESNISVISEPGRYFASPSQTIGCFVFGKRERLLPNGDNHIDYWISEGIYSSFNCKIFDNQQPVPHLLNNFKNENETENEIKKYSSTIFGPTCDGMDKVLSGNDGFIIEELNCGDWLMFPQCGAYTLAASSSFNGFKLCDHKFYIFSQKDL